MPTYDYQCNGPQQHRFERFQRFSEPPLTVCPECEADVHRVIHPVGVLFKGPGFYKTDNAPKAATAESEGTATESETPSEKVSDAPEKSAETKPKESKKAPAASATSASQD